MSKKIKFHTVRHADTEAKIQQTLNAEFALPKAVLEAKEQAFQQIRQGKALEESGGISHTKAKKRKTISKVYKIAGCTAAAAAVFSAVCITNPAWASNIPLIGNIFEELGNSLGFSGDYSEYAKPLQDAPKEERKEAGSAQDNASTADGEQDPKGTDTAFRKTVDGVTVTLSEVYCNDAALYLSLLVESEEPIPDTMMFQDKVPEIKLENSDMILSYNPDYTLLNAYLDGKMIDENTYAGVLRVDMKDTSINEAGQSAYYEARDAFLSEMGIDMEKVESGEISVDDIAQQLGLEEFSDEAIKEMGGPDMAEYAQPLEIPEKFTVDLSIGAIVGTLPQEMDTTPEMPQELVDEYNKAMAESGLDPDNYENFTEEEMEIEHQLYTEMWNKYVEMYPEMANEENSYNTWKYTGNWDFSFQVEKDHTKTVTKEVDLLDEEGNGILSVTRTPFEITLETKDPEAKYCAVVLDADGDLMEGARFGGYADVLAIQDRDVSPIYVYLCDYNEYMDELKGYYWSDDYEEKKKTKTFKELLDERAVLHTEVVFDEEEQ